MPLHSNSMSAKLTVQMKEELLLKLLLHLNMKFLNQKRLKLK
jgi:hypothetical protein